MRFFVWKWFLFNQHCLISQVLCKIAIFCLAQTFRLRGQSIISVALNLVTAYSEGWKYVILYHVQKACMNVKIKRSKVGTYVREVTYRMWLLWSMYIIVVFTREWSGINFSGIERVFLSMFGHRAGSGTTFSKISSIGYFISGIG